MQLKQLGKKQSADETVDLAVSIVKSLGAKWLIEMYDYFLQKPEIIINGFQKAGL